MTPEQEAKFHELREGLPIHLQALHKDGLAQPGAVCDASELAGELKAEAKRKALAADEAEAIGDKQVRENPSGKITEAGVKSAVALLPEVQTAHRAAIEAEAEAAKAYGLAEAYEHRKAMLKMEAELWVNNYWGDAANQTRQMRPVAEAGDAQRAERLEEQYAEARRRDKSGGRPPQHARGQE